MKPFDIELAKAGHAVCTRDGRAARIVSYDYKSSVGPYPIVAIVQDKDGEALVTYTVKGEENRYGGDDHNDLFLVTEHREGWMCIHKDKMGSRFGGIFPTKIEATAHTNASGFDFVTITKVEWEE